MGDNDVIREIMDRLGKIEGLLENNNKVWELKQQLYEKEIELVKEQIKVANNRIADLESANTWLTRTTIGSVITAALGLLFAFTKK